MLQYKHDSSSILAYDCYGHGKKVLIAFHGFGETPKHFQFLQEDLVEYTIYSISLFHHGYSKRFFRNTLNTKEWQKIFSGFLTHHAIDQFSLIAYSMGGRFAINTYISFHKNIQNIILVAPDGLIKKFWYELATFPIGLKQVFRYLMSNPNSFFKVMALLNQFNLINNSLVKFATKQLNNPSHRMMVYNCWVDFKYLCVSQRDLVDVFNQNHSKVHFIFGKNDKIISADAHQSFLSRITKSSITILDHGHGNLVLRSREIILKALDPTL